MIFQVSLEDTLLPKPLETTSTAQQSSCLFLFFSMFLFVVPFQRPQGPGAFRAFVAFEDSL